MIVLIAVQEKQVVITDQFVTQPITGRQSIFAKVAAPTEARFDIEIVGVYTDLDHAAAGRAGHAAAHPGRKYIQKVARLDDTAHTTPPVEAKCIMCGIVTGGPSFCGPCQKQHWAECSGADPLGGQGDPVPLVRVTSGGPLTLTREP